MVLNDCVVCFSLWGVGVRIAVWYETPWSKGQHTTPHCSFNVKSYPVQHTRKTTKYCKNRL